MRTNYVLIDYENVQKELHLLATGQFKVLVFVGASQKTKVPIETVVALQHSAKYIGISGNGHNALDFHIAYYIGKYAVAEPTANFHIISIDKGFDPLIQHLKAKKISVARWLAVGDIPLVEAVNAKTPPAQVAVSKPNPQPAQHQGVRETASTEQIAKIVSNLQSRGTSKPGTRKTLEKTIKNILPKPLSEPELAKLLKELVTKHYISINKTKVTYKLPPLAVNS
ncbi:MAG TPA: PIN domain-containing protein [Pirellulaceae bacterium]|nr:PIN domain-containing protein [Pirellulaceae bacterium]